MKIRTPEQPLDISFLADLESKNIEILIMWCTRFLSGEVGSERIDYIKETLQTWCDAYQKFLLNEVTSEPGDPDYCFKPAASVSQFEELMSLIKRVGAPAVQHALVYDQGRSRFAEKVFATDLGL